MIITPGSNASMPGDSTKWHYEPVMLSLAIRYLRRGL